MIIIQIVKRDGRRRKFNSEKIYNGIINAMTELGSVNPELAQEITNAMIAKFIGAETVKSEDLYEQLLSELVERRQYDLVSVYVRFREERNDTREVKSGLMKAISQINVETTRDNANVGNGPSAKMLQIGSEASRWYTLKHMPKHISKAHTQGWIHIHD